MGPAGADGATGPEGPEGPQGEPGAGASWEFPVGHVLIDTSNTNPATWLGYGTWAHWGVGRFLLGTGTTAGTEAGSATHSHGFTQPNAHTEVMNHTHVITASNTAATSGANATRGTGGQSSLTMPNPSGGVASIAHAGGAVADGATAPPSITAFLWRRTA
jgi:hypothetical protein